MVQTETLEPGMERRHQLNLPHFFLTSSELPILFPCWKCRFLPLSVSFLIHSQESNVGGSQGSLEHLFGVRALLICSQTKEIKSVVKMALK